MINRELTLDMGDIIDSVASDIQSGASVTLTGYGTSMKPLIAQGVDKIVLKKRPCDKKIKVGEIYLYRRLNGKYAIHRVYKRNKASVCMVGDSQLMLEDGIPNGNLIAKVVQIIKPDRIIQTEKTSFLLYYTVRMRYRQYCHRYKWLGDIHKIFRKVKRKIKNLIEKVKQ